MGGIMDLLNHSFGEASWQSGLKAESRDAALNAMLRTLCSDEFFTVNPQMSRNGILQALIEREALRTTAMGLGIAFPHARLEGLSHALFAVATLDEPVVFGDESVNIICLVLVPASDPSISLKLMAQFSRVLLEDDVREKVLAARSPTALGSFFVKGETNLDRPVCARDIMRMPRWSVNEDTPISRCARMMSAYQIRAIPVLGSRKQIVGEITPDLLFRYGLPDFFSRLKSVSFVAEFDPFEKYFEREGATTAGLLMSREFQAVPPEYTIMEIVFDLAVRKCNKLYVVDKDNTWIGTVTKGTILDNVINN
jgi:mannitol/fructose-specific phosphotransferase system IIA component (Ntr-type)/predicted transcriptional regulator